MKIAVFLSHPIQHFSPLWRELSESPAVYLKVFYYEDGIRRSFDQDFGVDVCWDVDLLAGYQYEFLGARRWPKGGMLPKMMIPSKGIPEVLRRGWDVVYIAGYAHVNNWLIVSICRRLNIPVLYHSDTNILIARQRPAVRLALKRLMITRFFQQITGFLAVGDRNRDYLLLYGAPPDRIHWCAIPVDIDRFRHAVRDLNESERGKLRAAYDIRPDDFVVGFCGKLRDIKRPQDLARAVRAVSTRRIVGLFIGSGMMDRTIREAGEDRVRITGFVNQSVIPKVLSLCDVTVMPSMRDNHPLVVTESQCLGIPVILSDKCGCFGPHDVFRDGESGILYPCGDVGALVNAIECLMDNPNLREEMGRRAKCLAETQSPGSSAAGFLTAAQAAVATPLAGKRVLVPGTGTEPAR